MMFVATHATKMLVTSMKCSEMRAGREGLCCFVSVVFDVALGASSWKGDEPRLEAPWGVPRSAATGSKGLRVLHELPLVGLV